MFDPVRDPSVSVWQSSIDKVSTRRRMSSAFGERSTPCAILAFNLAVAKVFGPPELATQLQGQFDFGQCDPFWAECVIEYAEHYKFADTPIPYRDGLDNLLAPIPASCKIALVGDWGTGTPEAAGVMSAIKAHQPDVVIHLGDIYYSGTRTECQLRFLDEMEEAFPNVLMGHPRCYSLCGNHDVYSGGEGYYWLVDQLGQGASYFAFENEDWLFIAGDTGKHDFALPAAKTFLEASELRWIENLVVSSGKRKVVFLTHHPLFSAFEANPFDAVNTALLAQTKGFLPQLTAWFWAHEHRLAIYDSHLGLARGRCLGHGAVPVLAAESDVVRFPEVPVIPVGMPAAPDGFNSHGYAVVELSGALAYVGYYALGSEGAVFSVFSEVM